MEGVEFKMPSPRQMKLDKLRQTKKMSPEEYEFEKMKIYGDDYVPSKNSPFIKYQKEWQDSKSEKLEIKLPKKSLPDEPIPQDGEDEFDCFQQCPDEELQVCPEEFQKGPENY
ncbi:unnamed protein product [Moneuplotes crassus]|uniref:Uncharacterized protein n=2 Tax=Euplotes crassus TaxID=5936 RepID=A0AAD1Y4I0_EUPCR|nr:unnamed protein product [Moneuplotes crassus]